MPFSTFKIVLNCIVQRTTEKNKKSFITQVDKGLQLAKKRKAIQADLRIFMHISAYQTCSGSIYAYSEPYQTSIMQRFVKIVIAVLANLN